MNRRLCGGRGSPWRTADDDAKVLFYKGFSFRYALVTTYCTYPEPTPARCAAGAVLRRASSETSRSHRHLVQRAHAGTPILFAEHIREIAPAVGGRVASSRADRSASRSAKATMRWLVEVLGWFSGGGLFGNGGAWAAGSAAGVLPLAPVDRPSTVCSISNHVTGPTTNSSAALGSAASARTAAGLRAHFCPNLR